MEIRVATICDFAQVREGLLSVVSAGINGVWQSQYPAQLGVMLALVIEIAAVEATEPREIRVRIESADGTRLAEASGGFQIQSIPGCDPGEMLNLPLVVDFREVQVPAPGRYQFVVDPMTEGVGSIPLSFRAGFPTDKMR